MFFFFNDPSTTEIYTLSLHDALPILGESHVLKLALAPSIADRAIERMISRSEEHTSELQSRPHLVCRLLLEKKKNKPNIKKLLVTPDPLGSTAPRIPTLSRAIKRGNH